MSELLNAALGVTVPVDQYAPDYVRRFADRVGLTVEQVRWCKPCGVVAYAADAFQRDQLDRLGFRDGLCPECRGWWG